MDKKIYIILAVVCLISLIILQNVFSPPKKKGTEPLLTIEKLEDLSNPLPLILLSGMYGVLFIGGTIMLVFFGIKKINKGYIIKGIQEEQTPLLSSHKLPKLFFLMAFYTLIIYMISIAILYSKWKPSALNLSVIANFIFQIGIAAIIFSLFSKKSLGFNFNNPHIADMFKVYIAIIPVLFSTFIINTTVGKMLGIEPSINPAVGMFINLKNNFFIFLLIIETAILAPIVEEILFRGIIYKVMRKKYSFFISSIFVSLIFATLHRLPTTILPLFVISFSLCYLYEKTKSIYTPILFHSIHNCLTIVSLFVMKGVF